MRVKTVSDNVGPQKTTLQKSHFVCVRVLVVTKNTQSLEIVRSAGIIINNMALIKDIVNPNIVVFFLFKSKNRDLG